MLHPPTRKQIEVKCLICIVLTKYYSDDENDDDDDDDDDDDEDDDKNSLEVEASPWSKVIGIILSLYATSTYKKTDRSQVFLFVF